MKRSVKWIGLGVVVVLVAVALSFHLTATPVPTPSPTPLPLPLPLPSPNPEPQKPPSAQPKITWSATSVEVILSPGESAIKNLTFSSSQNLQNAVIEPVSLLASFVTVQPSTLVSVQANQPQLVRLTFSIPTSAALGIYDGTIHVKSGTTTLPQTLKVVVSIWQKFTDSPGGYTVLIPPDLRALQTDSGFEVVRLDTDTDEEAPALRFRVDPNPRGLTSQEYYDGDPGVDLFSEFNTGARVRPVSIDGVAGVRVEPVVTFAGAVVIVVPRSGDFFRIVDDGETFQASNLFDTILSTIHLLRR